MVGWPHWHVTIWERLVVNWILERVFDRITRVLILKVWGHTSARSISLWSEECPLLKQM